MARLFTGGNAANGPLPLANPALTAWSMADALPAVHLSGSDTAALVGDPAYQYGKNGTLAGMSLAAAQAVIGDPLFGVQAQTLHPPQDLQGATVSLIGVSDGV